MATSKKSGNKSKNRKVDGIEFPQEIVKRVYMFVKAEIIKRHFEYIDQDALWLKEHWDDPLKCEKDLLVDEKILVLNDIVLIHYKYDKNETYSSLISNKTNNLYIKIMREYRNWIDEIYRLSLKYGLSAIDLANPYDIKDVIEKDLIFHEEEAIRTRNTNKFPFPIPTFLDAYQKSFVFCRKTKGDNLYFDVKLTDSNFNIEDTLNFIADQICVYMLENNKKLSENVKYRLNNIVERDNESEKYSNSIRTRILGLAQWDHRIKYLSEEYNNIKEFKRFLFKNPKYCSYCDRTPGTSGCPCPSSACAAALTRQLYSAVSSIEAGRVTDIKNAAKQVPKNAKMIFDRISIPYDELPHLQSFFSKL